MIYKISTIMLAIYYFFCPLVPPSTEDPIKVLNDAEIKLNFVALADPQISDYILNREPGLRATGDDIKNAESHIDALVIAGDITENSHQFEYDIVTEDIIDTGVDYFITATGNHDIRWQTYKRSTTRFFDFQNNLNKAAGNDLVVDKLYYTYDINGYTFIVLGSDRTETEEAYFNKKQLIWLDKTLEEKTSDEKPVFVIIHQVFRDTHGLPLTWGNGKSTTGAGSMGEQNDDVLEIFSKYNNIIMLSGHLHTGFGQYSYEKINNFDSINIPSTGIENQDGYENNGTGYMVEVYDDEVIFRARDFELGKYLPEYDIKIAID